MHEKKVQLNEAVIKRKLRKPARGSVEETLKNCWRLMADDKTTKMPEQPVTDTGPGMETPPEPEKTPTSPEAEKKTEQQAKSPQVSVYDFAEIMKGKNEQLFRL